ncbi:MAG: pyridoxal 5'-phosphate synthase glutaminase subunit PdxT [Candidatus Zixiibacteriota bacterium]|nr:MAG: pyridoxal 5'-phosphate synthase glutaminase subunit PdxT [candidate division Zixibacteria bacterium]
MADYSKLKVGVLALQGDFKRHTHQLGQLGSRTLEVRTASHLEEIDGLIIPGGESTTMDILIDRFRLRQPLIEFCQIKPVWGTCAGMIMLAKNIEDNQANVSPLGLMDIDVVRTGYGRQVHSFEQLLMTKLNGEDITLRATFIRAPMITRVGKSVQILIEYNGSPVLVSEGLIMASSFHTELDNDTTLLEFFMGRFLLSQK